MKKPNENANCPYCLSPIAEGEEKVRCPKCGVAHHADCWKDNGKCSVYGCDGWVLWSDEITNKLAPPAASNVEVADPSEQKTKTEEAVLCIECGKPIKRGKMMCWECRRKQKNHYFDNCSGPAILFIGGAIYAITLIIRALA